MAALPEFMPYGSPGQTAEVAGRAMERAGSWMDRAQTRRLREEEAQRAREQFTLLQPLKQAQARANLAKAGIEYQGVLQTQAARETAYQMLDEARADFYFVNQIKDAKLRAQSSREWLSRYSQLANIEELSAEMKQKNNLATNNIVDLMKLQLLQGAEERFYNNLTKDFTDTEKAKAARVKTGVEARPSSAAIQYKEVLGSDGQTRLIAVDPREVGAHAVGSGEQYGSGVGPIDRAPTGSQEVFRSPTLGEQTRMKEQAQKDVEYEMELRKEKPKRTKAIQQAEILADRMTSDIDELIGKVNVATAGPGGVLLDKFPGTSARDLKSQIDSLKANIGFQTLQAMREASPTGGALGQVSDIENRLLQSVLGSLEIGQSPKQLVDNLRKIRQRITENYGIARAAYRSQYGEIETAPSAEDSPGWTADKERRLQELRAKLGK